MRHDIEEIYRIAKLGGVNAAEVSSVKSGVALELEYQQLYSTLSEKADNVEQAEQKVLELWAKWEGKVFDGRIDYPDDFSIRDIERDLQNVISARGAAVESATFDKELQRRIVRAVLPKTDDATLVRIGEEIEAGSTAGRL